MKCISNHCKTQQNLQVFNYAEAKFKIQIRDDIKEFLKDNSGGYPVKDIVKINGDEYEVRNFLSLNYEDKNYYIEKSLDFFLSKTKGKIIPIGLDSGDNYYCVNNETGKVYYWSASDDQYYYISSSLDEFMLAFE